jgi:dTDP-4-dehydrorhamnose 3,5-epimerase
MKVTTASIPDVLIVEPTVFEDARGFFYESFNERRFAELTGIGVRFVQDNHSKSAKNVLRGLHYQIMQPQGKLIRVVAGAVFDVSVDIRKGSATFGRWTGIHLSADNKRQVWVPPGFAHGFVVTSESAEVLYKTTTYWAPEYERAILWSDPDIGINWPIQGVPLVSPKDAKGTVLSQAEVFE